MGGLNHITLTVSDLARSLAFYQGALGFHGHVSWRRGAYLSLENCWLCLTLGEPQVSQDYSHFAFSCDQAKMQDLITRRDELGLRVWQSNSSEGDSLYLLDPDGHKLELHQGNLASRLAYLKSHPYDGLKWL
ncbi:VOC family protein [Marinomonas epiphytica]